MTSSIIWKYFLERTWSYVSNEAEKRGVIAVAGAVAPPASDDTGREAGGAAVSWGNALQQENESHTRKAALALLPGS